MIVGHLGVAAALARWRPRASPWWLIPAAIAPDLLDLAYAVVGFCNPYGLYSHTVPAALLLGAGIAGAAVLSGRRETAALVLLAVLLHLPFDYPTGRKLLWPGGELHGLMLYDHPLTDFAMETLLVVGGWALVRRDRRLPRWVTSAWAVAAAVVLQGAVDILRMPLKPNACRAAEAVLPPSPGRGTHASSRSAFPPPSLDAAQAPVRS